MRITHLLVRMPEMLWKAHKVMLFEIKAIQTDSGSEFVGNHARGGKDPPSEYFFEIWNHIEVEKINFRLYN